MVEELARRRRGPFIVAAALGVATIVAVVALPGSLLVAIERGRPLTDTQSGWAYRMLAFFTLLQVVYTGGTVFRIEKVAAAREKDPRLAALPKERVIASLARNAAALVLFTFVYGLASIAITGLRGGFWLFPLIAIAQGAWYYREIGQIATWKSFQPEQVQDDPDLGRWRTVPPDHCPAITRALIRPLPETNQPR